LGRFSRFERRGANRPEELEQSSERSSEQQEAIGASSPEGGHQMAVERQRMHPRHTDYNRANPLSNQFWSSFVSFPRSPFGGDSVISMF